MPDDHDVRVQIARLDGRLEGVERGLGRQEQSCEARSQTHVQRELYASEKAAIDASLADGRTEFANLRAALATEKADRERADTAERKAREQEIKDVEERRVRERRWLIAGVIVPAIGFAIPLLVVVLT